MLVSQKYGFSFVDYLRMFRGIEAIQLCTQVHKESRIEGLGTRRLVRYNGPLFWARLLRRTNC